MSLSHGSHQLVFIVIIIGSSRHRCIVGGGGVWIFIGCQSSSLNMFCVNFTFLLLELLLLLL